MDKIDFKVYFIVVRDIVKGLESIYSINNDVLDMKKLVTDYFNLFIGNDYLLTLDDKHKIKRHIEFVTNYKIEPEVYKILEESEFGITNGCIDLDVIQVDFLTFKLNEFIEERKKD